MDSSSSNEQLVLCATLEGHKGAVTSIATSPDVSNNFIVTGSRDHTALLWVVQGTRENFAVAKKSLSGHNHFVSDVTLSHDGRYALTCSWDKTMRLWNLATAKTERIFAGHSHDVLSASFSADDEVIVSSSRDKSIKVWNTQGTLMGDFSTSANGRNNLGHTEWVSAVRFSPDATTPLVVSCGFDKLVKIWDLSARNPTLAFNHVGHTGYVNTVAVSPDGTLCASGGKDGTVMLWDLNDPKHLYSLEAGNIIHSLIFSPTRYWLCAATEKSIKIWDLVHKTIVDELCPEFPIVKSGINPYCLSLAWSADGSTLYSGYTDSKVRVWQVSQRSG